jgi:hypothetical protein
MRQDKSFAGGAEASCWLRKRFLHKQKKARFTSFARPVRTFIARGTIVKNAGLL